MAPWVIRADRFGAPRDTRWQPARRATTWISMWSTLGVDQAPEANQLMEDNRHLGKIPILAGADAEGLDRTADGAGDDFEGGPE